MTKSPAKSPRAVSRFSKALTSVTTWLNRPENTILLVLGLILSFAVLYPLWSVVQNSLTIHAGKEQMIRYASILLDIADGTGKEFDELLLEQHGNICWIHFAVRPPAQQNRRRIAFLRP